MTACVDDVTQIIELLSPMTTYAPGLDQLRFGSAAGWSESDVTTEDVVLMSLRFDTTPGLDINEVDQVSSSVDDEVS